MLKLAIAGLGHVGGHVVALLQRNAGLIAARAGQEFVVKAVSARDRGKQRICDLSGIEWVDDPQTLATRPDIDAVVEVIGGADGPAYNLATASLKSGKHLITANKALIAAHGVQLADMAQRNNLSLSFEAAVAGGIPALKTLREGMAGNRLQMVGGVLNGTCNYILTRMQAAGLDFQAALKEAQDKGYAEANPAADIEGVDTANKLAILAALAFGCPPDLAAINIEGISRITPQDLAFTDQVGYRIKLLGMAMAHAQGMVQKVAPTLVAKTSPLAAVDGALNAVLLRGDYAGDIVLTGAGAGGEATASAVVADLIDLARGNRSPAFGIAPQNLRSWPAIQPLPSRYYLRLQAVDNSAVLADIGAVLRDQGVACAAPLQAGLSAAFLTGDVTPDLMAQAAAVICMRFVLAEPPLYLPVMNETE